MKKLLDDYFVNEETPATGSLELVRLGQDETSVILMTKEGEEVSIHFVEDPEIHAYVHCNGDGCVLCQVGKKPSDRFLLPVYLPGSQSIGVLSMPTGKRPKALMPQIQYFLKAGKPMVLWITKSRFDYEVSSKELEPGMDDGAAVIKRFQELAEEKPTELGQVYPRIENEQLQLLPEISRLLALKGGLAS